LEWPVGFLARRILLNIGETSPVGTIPSAFLMTPNCGGWEWMRRRSPIPGMPRERASLIDHDQEASMEMKKREGYF